MTNVDQFESVFRAAAKPVFHYASLELAKVLVVTDLPPDETSAFGERVRGFLSAAEGADEATFETVAGVQARSTGDLIGVVEKAEPDLICAYRNLYSDGWQWPHSLGEALDVLTQTAKAPVMVLPHPKAEREAGHAMRDTNRVMAVTDHLAGDDALVNWAVAMAQPGGKLFLSHVEDEAGFERMIELISRIPSIDTDNARERLKERVLKEPHDYIRSCAERLAAASIDVSVEEIVTLGRRLGDYRRLVDEHEIDLLVMHTRDEEQLAMHGLAYPIAVEFRHIPLLML